MTDRGYYRGTLANTHQPGYWLEDDAQQPAQWPRIECHQCGEQADGNPDGSLPKGWVFVLELAATGLFCSRGCTEAWEVRLAMEAR